MLCAYDHRCFREMFPNDFHYAIAIVNHEEVDRLMLQLDGWISQLDRAATQLRETGERRLMREKWTDIFRGVPKVDAIQLCKAKIKELHRAILAARARAPSLPTPSWLVLFKSQQAARLAAMNPILPEHKSCIKVARAPGPDEVFYPSLWLNGQQRSVQGALWKVPLVLLLCVPMATLSASLAQLDYYLCPTHNPYQSPPPEGGEDPDASKWDWYCNDEGGFLTWLLSSLIVGWLPSVLLLLWTSLVLPRFVCYFIKRERKCFSFSAIDRRISWCYFYYDVFNMFVCGMVGASIFQQLSQLLQDSVVKNTLNLLGTALPSSSNFFISYILTKALIGLPMRLLAPHNGVRFYLVKKMMFKLFRYTVSSRVKYNLFAPRSLRLGVDTGNMMLIFVIGIAFSVVSPMVMPMALLYFLIAWVVWRYTTVYVYVRKYESGGLMWPAMSAQLVLCLWLFWFFNLAVLLSKKGWVQMAVLGVLGPPWLYVFRRYLKRRFSRSVLQTPLASAMSAPRVAIDPATYVAPPLRAHAWGWHPDWMNVWEGYGSSKPYGM